jgi:hypothetical protein
VCQSTGVHQVWSDAGATARYSGVGAGNVRSAEVGTQRTCECGCGSVRAVASARVWMWLVGRVELAGAAHRAVRRLLPDACRTRRGDGAARLDSWVTSYNWRGGRSACPLRWRLSRGGGWRPDGPRLGRPRMGALFAAGTPLIDYNLGVSGETAVHASVRTLGRRSSAAPRPRRDRLVRRAGPHKRAMRYLTGGPVPP